MIFNSILLSTTLLFSGMYQSGTQLAWDMLTTDIPAVVRYEINLNGGAYSSVGLGTVISGAPAGFTTIGIPLPVLVKGDNTWTVRACTDLTCSTPSNPYTVKAIGAPGNLRIK